MSQPYPAIGHWFCHPGGPTFEIVAIDEEAQTIEIQQFDGTIDEYELDSWDDLLAVEVEQPEDWSGAVDMDPEDYSGKKKREIPPGYQNPLAFLDKH